MNDHETNVAALKIVVAWLGVFFGGLTLSNVALGLTVVFTALQIYKLARDLWFAPKDRP